MGSSTKAQPTETECVEQRWHLPVFTASTFCICLIVMIWELHENGVHAGPGTTEDCTYAFEIQGARFCTASFAVNPFLGPTAQSLLKMGGRFSYLIVEQKEYWRLIVPIYLHAGIVHFLVNMFIFVQVGVRLEWLHGCWKVGSVYLLSGVFGVVMGAIFSSNTIGVGASGAIFGLIGACIGDLIQNWALYKHARANLFSLVVVSVVQLLLGTIPMLDNFAHFFGFLMGLVSSLALLVLQRVTKSGRHLDAKCHQRLLQVSAAILVPCVFVAAVMVLFAGSGSDLCPHCQKISCVPFPWGCDESGSSGDCWWDCTAVTVDPRCSATMSYQGDLSNGTVVVHCPLRDTFQNVTRHPVDVSVFDKHTATTFCMDFCPEA